MYTYEYSCTCFKCRSSGDKHKPKYIKIYGAVKITKGQHKKTKIISLEKNNVVPKIKTFLLCYYRHVKNNEELSIFPLDIILLIANHMLKSNKIIKKINVYKPD